MTIDLERPQKSISTQIWERLGYAIIDTGVHTEEFTLAFLEYLEQVGVSIPTSFKALLLRKLQMNIWGVSC